MDDPILDEKLSVFFFKTLAFICFLSVMLAGGGFIWGYAVGKTESMEVATGLQKSSTYR